MGTSIAFVVLGEEGAETGNALAAFRHDDAGWSKVAVEPDRKFHPWDIDVAEFDDDAEPEVIVAVRKGTRRDPVVRDRLFVFDWSGDRFLPKWLGSHLGQPVVAWSVQQNPDGRSRLLCVQQTGTTVALRRLVWSGFGFALDAELVQVQAPGRSKAVGDSLVTLLERIAAIEQTHVHRFSGRGDGP